MIDGTRSTTIIQILFLWCATYNIYISLVCQLFCWWFSIQLCVHDFCSHWLLLEMLVASLFLSSNIFVIKSWELCCRTLNMDKFGQILLVLVFLIFDILLIIVLALLVTSDGSVVLHSKCLLFNWNAYLTVAGCLQKSTIRFTFRWRSHRRERHLLNQKRKFQC